MITFDVTNLCCNIPHEIEKQTILLWIEKYTGTLHPRFNPSFITDTEQQLFPIQQQKLRPNPRKRYRKQNDTNIRHPNLSMLRGKSWNHRGKYSNNIKMDFIRSQKRYRDNCVIFWKCPWCKINHICNLFQNLHPMIKLTIEHSFKVLQFLGHPH